MVCLVTKAARIESNRCVIDNILQWNVYWTDLNGFQSFVFNNSSFNLNNFSVVPIYGTPNTQIIISNTNAGAKKNYIWLEESQRF